MAQEMFLRKIPEDMRPWECNVNGVKYVYPAGTEQNVPAEVAALIDAYWEKQEVDYPETGISFNDLKDKPFYSEVVESVDVEVKEQTITSVTNSSGKHNAKLYNEDTGLVATKDNTHVIVVFDGELFDLRSNNNLLGNRAILGVAGAVDTGEPFHIVMGNSVTNIYTKTPGDHTIAITVYKEETVYHTIDPKFLPGGGGGMLVTVTLNDDDTFTPDKTFQEAINAVAAGVDVRFVIQQEGSGNRTFPSLINANIGDELIEDQKIWLSSNWSGEQYRWTASRFVIHGGSE